MIASNKQELINEIKLSYSKLGKELESIGGLNVLDKVLEGHIKNTNMSFHNLLSYLVGRGELMLKWDKINKEENIIPDLPETGYTMNDWGKLALKFYKDYENYSFEELSEKFHEIVNKIIDFIDNSDNSRIYGKPWYITKSSSKGYTFGRMIALNTSSPYKNAYVRIRKYKKENNI